MDLALETSGPLPDVPLHAVSALTKVSLSAAGALAGPLQVSRGGTTWPQSELLPEVPLHLSTPGHHQLNAIAVKTEGKKHQRHA
jgi:hypothetical protein